MNRKVLALGATMLLPVMAGLLTIQAPSIVAVALLALLGGGGGLLNTLLIIGLFGLTVFLGAVGFGQSEQKAALIAL